MKIKHLFKKEKIVLSLIFILALAIRLISQPRFPDCLHRDEVQFSYNAYSILKTGKDEWGQLLPFHFKFNGEGHVPMIFYLGALTMLFTGPKNIAIRIPAIILGSLIPIISYFIAKKIFNKKIALIFSILLTFNPWQIINSRASGEISIISLFFGILAFSFIFSYLKNQTQNKYLYLSLINIFFAYQSYIASRLDIPLMLILFLLIFYKEISKKNILLIITIIILPFILVAISPKRFTGTSIITKHFFPQDSYTQGKYQEEIRQSKLKFFKTHSKNLIFEFIENYFDYLNPYYIFRNIGEPIRVNIKEIGPLYLFEFFTVLIGLYVFIKNPDTKTKKFLLISIIITPISGALTYNSPDRPNTQRTVYFYYLLILFSALGLYTIFNQKIKKKPKLYFHSFILLIILSNFVFFYRQLFVFSPFYLNQYRDCAYPKLTNYIKNTQENYKKIYIGTEYDYPYIHFLWNNKYSPQKYHEFLKNPQTKDPIFLHTQDKYTWQLDNLVFIHRTCLYEKDENVLLVGQLNNCKDKYLIQVKKDKNSNRLVFLYPDGSQTLYQYVKDISLINGTKVFYLYTYDKEKDQPLAPEELKSFTEI